MALNTFTKAGSAAFWRGRSESRLRRRHCKGTKKYTILSQAVKKRSEQLVRWGTGDLTGAHQKPLFGLDAAELAARMVEAGETPWRGRQLAEALYRQRIGELEAITTLPTLLRLRLADEGWVVGRPRIAEAFQSVDGTERYLVQCQDEQTVETVWMPEGDGGEAGDGSGQELVETDESGKRRQRATLCVSSQVGCAVNCQFCLTAKLGFQRNLTAGEIAGQVVAVFERQGIEVGRDRVNLVFMGMGEPFLNYDAFMQSVHVLRAMGIPESRMTVSTSGIEPAIRRFATEPIRPKLALSLNASNDAVRRQIMPVTRKWKIAALLDALRAIPLGKREYVTFEYVLLGGVNDQPRHAREVLALLKGMKAKVNLIVWNPGPGIDFREPAPQDVAVFHRMLIDGGIPAFTRKPRGRDIYAACGQLKRTVDAPGPLVEIASS